MTCIDSYKECPSCGSNHKGKPFCIYENGAHCFSCGYTKTYDRSFLIPESRIPQIPDQPDAKSNPDDFNITNLKWLNKYYMTPKLIKKHNIKEASDGALIFCVIENNKIVHCQKRYIREKRLILSYGKKTPLIKKIGSNKVVIVEDPISCIRISEHCDSICLWGTKTSYEFLKSLQHYSKILVWLDNDASKETNSGQEAAKKICKMLKSIVDYNRRRFGFGAVRLPEIRHIITDCDPKVYSPSEISNILEEDKCAHQN